MPEEQYIEFIGEMPSGGNYWVYISGTIQEALNSLSTYNINARKVIYWSDDGTNANCLFCKRM